MIAIRSVRTFLTELQRKWIQSNGKTREAVVPLLSESRIRNKQNSDGKRGKLQAVTIAGTCF